MVLIDLKTEAYHSVPVAMEHRKFLNLVERNTLPLCSSFWIESGAECLLKLLKPVLAKLHTQRRSPIDGLSGQLVLAWQRPATSARET